MIFVFCVVFVFHLLDDCAHSIMAFAWFDGASFAAVAAVPTIDCVHINMYTYCVVIAQQPIKGNINIHQQQ